MPSPHIEQMVRIYVAGMTQHSNQAMQAMQDEVNAGWHIDHVASLSSGLLLVVYGRPRAIAERRFPETPR